MKKLSRFWFWVIKICIVVISYSYIYYQLVYEKEKLIQWQTYDWNFKKTGFIFIVFLLMILNWSLETVKWRILVHPIERLAFFRSFKGIIIGLTVSIFTPNRTGEYFGRIWILSQKRIQGIFATITGSIAQLSITLIAGIISLTFFTQEQEKNIFLYYDNYYLIILISIGLAIFIFTILFSMPQVIQKITHHKKILSFIDFIKYYSSKDIIKVLLLSAMRYFIFIIQFYILINVFDIELDFKRVFFLLALVYFAMVFIPSFTLAEIGIRGSLAIAIFSIFVLDTTGIFLAISLLWIINIALPAFVGSFFLLKLKLKENATA
ncbi:MAG TPA: hypothetical protein EYP69_02860 [Bacteroidales bacterium]|nr:hypothetical protein [Bacteroidales bacterium]